VEHVIAVIVGRGVDAYGPVCDDRVKRELFSASRRGGT